VLALLGALVGARGVRAQGVTTAEVYGTVSAPSGTPLDGATVTLSDRSSGMRWEAVTGRDGRYVIANVEIGGPYRLQARAVGFATAVHEGIMLALNQRYAADFTLDVAAITLAPVLVAASPGGDASHADPAMVVTAADMARLPNLQRDLTSLATLSPFVTVRPLGGVSLAGQNDLYTGFQVDGGSEQDGYFGRSPGGPSAAAGLPGVLPRAISLEAVREFQVLVAPFDVRQGGAPGGILNAVTRSGTNAFHGSAFVFLQNDALAGADAAGNASPAFTTWQLGGTISGPIVRDKVQFFLNVDAERQSVPDPGPLVTDTAGGVELARTGVTFASAQRFQRILADQYGLDPGSMGSSNGTLPAAEVFAKISVGLGTNSHLEVTQHVAHGERSGFMDVGRAGVNRGTVLQYGLTSVAGTSRSTALITRATWHALLAARAANELIVSWQQLHDACQPAAAMPNIQVNVDSAELVAGPNQVCSTTDIRQRTLELTDNVTLVSGRHTFVVGTHDELLHFRDPLLLTSVGQWQFDNLDSLASGQASSYTRGIALTPTPPVTDFTAVQLGGYVQDRWALSRRVEITGGLRVDAPLLPDRATTNDSVLATFGFDTGRLPSVLVQWSPRIAVDVDLLGDQQLALHGGLGLFGGPAPYRWLANGYRDNGLQDATLTCDAPLVPPFDPRQQPTTCLSGRGGVPRVTVFDPATKMPQTLRGSVGVVWRPRATPGTEAALDLLYSRATSQLYVTDLNLGGPVDTAADEAGRLLYGRPAGTALRAVRPHVNFGRVVLVESRSGDDALTASGSLRARLGSQAELYAAYAYSRVRDRMSLQNFATQALLNNAPLDGTLADRTLTASLFDTPHRVTLAASAALPWRSRISLLYSGASGPPFTYVVDGDANGDGLGPTNATYHNDPVYIPRLVAPGGDIELADRFNGNLPAPAADYTALESFIENTPCLRAQRGRLVGRNSCRNEWQGILSARLQTTVQAPRSHALTLMADVFNLLNLIDGQWGRQRLKTTGASVVLLSLVRWDGERGVYQWVPQSDGIETPNSRWRIQISTRYAW
jgi:hypothetical protein